MGTQKTPLDLVNDMTNNLDYMHTLLGAAEDKVLFYLENRKLLGPYEKLLSSCALELETLLFLMRQFVVQMGTDTEAVTELLCGKHPPCATQ